MVITSASKRHPLVLRPRLREALDCMLCRETPEEFARATGVELGTAWSTFNTALCQAAHHIEKNDLVLVAKDIVPADMWKLLRRMEKEGDPILSGRLSDLMYVVKGDLDGDGEFEECDSDTQWGSLRFARAVLASRS